ncbi:MAG: DUF1269 domain-containing protein [Anaerolineales bacterium]
MIKFPLDPNARVQLLDNKHATVQSVVINPAQQSVLYFVVRDAREQRWLVPLEYVIEADDDLVTLKISSDEFSQLSKFDESQYLLGGDEENDFFKAGDNRETPIYFLADYDGEADFSLEKNLALIRGAFVEASDGMIGTIEEIAIDPKSGFASQLIIHTMGREKVETVIPASMIDHVEVDSVYLKITRSEFEELPSVPVKYTRTGKIRYQMLAKIYDSTAGAGEAYKQWKELWDKQSTRFIYSAAVLIHDEKGEISISETLDVDKRHGRLFGAVAGGLVGLVGGPVGLVVGLLAGAGIGGVTADKLDRGISNHFLKAFTERLKPGTSALIVLIDSEGVPAVEDSLGQLGGILVQEELTDEMLDEFAGGVSDG